MKEMEEGAGVGRGSLSDHNVDLIPMAGGRKIE